MDIAIGNILPIERPAEYKVHFAVHNGDEQPLDVFARDFEEWKGWNSYRGERNRFNRQFIFSLMRYYHHPERWLFGGIFEVVERHHDAYTINLVDRYREYIGRLLIKHPGAGVPGASFYLESYFNQFVVAQIFDSVYEGQVFCGYENIEHSFSQLEAIIRKNKADWKASLENIKGVYLIIDKSNGKGYVGSAYGDSGIWARWASYIITGHGGNDQLVKLISDKGIDYARKNFQFSLLEFRPMKTDDQTIQLREQYWKRVLQTFIPHGYNKN